MDKFIIRKKYIEEQRTYQIVVPSGTHAVLRDLKKKTGLTYGALLDLMVKFCTEPGRLVIEDMRGEVEE